MKNLSTPEVNRNTNTTPGKANLIALLTFLNTAGQNAYARAKGQTCLLTHKQGNNFKKTAGVTSLNYVCTNI